MNCRICGNSENNRDFVAREISYGTLEEFDYFECAACGAIQIAREPEDIGRFYPHNYYSFQAPQDHGGGVLKRWLKRRRSAYALNGVDPLGWTIARLSGGLPDMLRFFRLMRLRMDSRILDVGCGSGDLLLTLKAWGFTRLAGVDPFIERDLDHGGLPILNSTLAALPGRFDALMYHHSFEHIFDQHAELEQVRAHLEPGGALLIRVPVAGSWAWRHYGINWAGLDAPRHLLLNSARSLKMLGEQHGFMLEHTVYDSSARQFWVGEQNLLGIPICNPESYFFNRISPHFGAQQLAQWQREAERLNREQDGDCAAFMLRMR